jgi:hypothetical protein
VPDGRKLSESTDIASGNFRSGNFRRSGKTRVSRGAKATMPGRTREGTTDYTEYTDSASRLSPAHPCQSVKSVKSVVNNSDTSRRPVSISRITPRSQQDQVIRSRRSRPRRPGTSHPLSRKAPGVTRTDSSPSGPTVKPSTSLESRSLVPTERSCGCNRPPRITRGRCG